MCQLRTLRGVRQQRKGTPACAEPSLGLTSTATGALNGSSRFAPKNPSVSACNHASVRDQWVWMHAIKHTTNVAVSTSCKACSCAGAMLLLQHQYPCSRSGSQSCLFCVAAFVTTQTQKTPESFMLMSICLVMYSSIEAVTVLNQSHDSPCCHDFINNCACIQAFSHSGPC